MALATAVLTLVVVDNRASDYETTGTYVVRPQLGTERDVVRATANLSGAAKITNTFAYIAESELIEARARAGLDQRGLSPDAVEIEAAVAPGTNVVSITVRSDDPDDAFEMALAVGAETVRYVDGVEDVYDLAVIDPPGDPLRLLGAWASPVWLVSAAGVGLMGGTGAVLLANLLFPRGLRARRRRVAPVVRNDVDDDEYTRMRMRQEMARTDDTGVPLTLAVMRVEVPFHDHLNRERGVVPLRRNDVSRVAKDITPLLKDFEHVRHVGGSGMGTFTVLMPMASEARADQVCAGMRDAAIRHLDKSHRRGVRVSTSSCRYKDQEFSGEADACTVISELVGNP